jgi:ankyrin repeat protein
MTPLSPDHDADLDLLNHYQSQVPADLRKILLERLETQLPALRFHRWHLLGAVGLAAAVALMAWLTFPSLEKPSRQIHALALPATNPTTAIALAPAATFVAYDSERLMEGRTFRELDGRADIIVVGRPISTEDTAEQTYLPNISPPIPAIGLSSGFEVSIVIKGDKSLKKLVVHHYRLRTNPKGLDGGPNLASFNPTESTPYLLFLQREPDGRYAPFDQVDPLATSMLKLDGPEWGKMKLEDFKRWLDAMKWLDEQSGSGGPVPWSNLSPRIPPGGAGDGSLHEAAFNGKLEKAEALVKENPGLVNSQDSYAGQTPLHLAVKYGHEDVAELLLANKADVEAKANGGWTPLLNAVFGGHKDLVELLLAHKADVNVEDNSGRTPLQVAAENGFTEIAGILLAHKAHVNARTHDGMTPLHTATALGYKDLVELLLANDADVNAKDSSGRTPLGFALLHKNNEMAELLRKHGGFAEEIPTASLIVRARISGWADTRVEYTVERIIYGTLADQTLKIDAISSDPAERKQSFDAARSRFVSAQHRDPTPDELLQFLLEDRGYKKGREVILFLRSLDSFEIVGSRFDNPPTYSLDEAEKRYVQLIRDGNYPQK